MVTRISVVGNTARLKYRYREKAQLCIPRRTISTVSSLATESITRCIINAATFHSDARLATMLCFALDFHFTLLSTC